ncbi:A/G-specific adenine glycosylase [Agaribacterium haliotis]|uniref:A/G-specific adenine glycosylase n=1 Tax=Agaribacterium haliotis TaxID=2013869 RepID=UPI000BB592D1|nr:A/G-specific adenine glycosylase [Agaribacterium haliotis]
MTNSFSAKLLRWFDQHGRHDLPWQHQASPYKTWLSEVMLQQTQVSTVIPYFLRFIERFPTLKQLADADIDEVMHLWTGLGYYSRARNLHRCAQEIRDHYNGELPQQLEQLQALPGIGPSTAAAIASIAFNQSTAILDGNVKRVLTRFHAIEGWPGKREVEKQLWQLAQEHMPKKRCGDYTQAIMDLGATLCTRSKAQCQACPMKADCQALALERVQDFPYSKPKQNKPVKEAQLLIIRRQSGEIALQLRPPTGIWGGLWSLPELKLDESPEDFVQSHFGEVLAQQKRDKFKHVFSHYSLLIHPVEIQLGREHGKIMEQGQLLWYNPHFPQEVGLAAPVKSLLHL